MTREERKVIGKALEKMAANLKSMKSNLVTEKMVEVIDLVKCYEDIKAQV